jgi:hypothetical protein
MATERARETLTLITLITLITRITLITLITLIRGTRRGDLARGVEHNDKNDNICYYLLGQSEAADEEIEFTKLTIFF